jgi:hypothetical protein
MFRNCDLSINYTSILNMISADHILRVFPGIIGDDWLMMIIIFVNNLKIDDWSAIYHPSHMWIKHLLRASGHDAGLGY